MVVVGMDELFKSGNPERVWQKYCGFLDLSLDEFLAIQEQLLTEELDLVCPSPLGKLLIPARPRSITEFRRSVPFTKYADYAPFFSRQDASMLAFKPAHWARTSGRGGNPKWAPCAPEYLQVASSLVVSAAVLACAGKRGEVKIGNGVRVLHNFPPTPYAVNYFASGAERHLAVNFMPDLASYDNETFEKRMKAGFEEALTTGADVLSSLSSVLVKMGKHFEENSGQLKFNPRMLHPRVALRLLMAKVRAKRENRSVLPRDLWPLSGLICYGMDTEIFKTSLIRYWGRTPLELYAATETGIIAMQAWNKKGLTFTPQSAFYEFIPEEEFLKNRQDNSYTPGTVLMNEVEPGKKYELVVTSFYGMPFIRYRIGDLVRCTGYGDAEMGVKLPQFVFATRADDIIDIAGFARLDEKTVWQAIARTGLAYEDWCIRKEYENERPVLHLYLELTGEAEAPEVQQLVHRELMTMNSDYFDVEEMLDLHPLRVTLLAPGSFNRYYRARQAQGADLAHLKPPHVNASDQIIAQLAG